MFFAANETEKLKYIMLFGKMAFLKVRSKGAGTLLHVLHVCYSFCSKTGRSSTAAYD
jgi:hypothetical protein